MMIMFIVGREILVFLGEEGKMEDGGGLMLKIWRFSFDFINR